MMRYRASIVVLPVSLTIDDGVIKVLVTAGAVIPILHGTAHEAMQQSLRASACAL